MDKIITNGELEVPRFVIEGWDYRDKKTGERRLKPDAPEWAKREFEEFHEKLNTKPDENGIITRY